MTYSNSKSSLKIKQAIITFTDKPITAWGGLGVLSAAFLEQIQFREWVESNFPISEKSNNGGGIFAKILAQFLTVQSGGDRFSHLNWWGAGVEVIKTAFGLSWLPQAASTLTRFWGKFKQQSQLEQWAENARGLVRTIIQEGEEICEDTLNLDSTVLVRYGYQEGAKKGFNPKKPGRASHHPLLAFLGSGYVVNFWNRSGDTHSGHLAREFFQQSRQSLGKNFRIRHVLCDTGFYHAEFLDDLERDHLKYIIAAPLIPVLQQKIFQVEQWQEIEEGIECGEFYFQHTDEKWTYARRYVAIRQQKEIHPKATGKQPLLFQDLEGWENYRFGLFITNFETLPPAEVWRTYRPRACDENVIKDLKEGYGLESFNLKGFWATEAVLVLHALVFYNLIHLLTRKVLSRNQPLSHLKTLRGKWYIVPAQLGSKGRRKIIRLGVKTRKKRGRWRYVLHQIQFCFSRFKCIAQNTDLNLSGVT